MCVVFLLHPTVTRSTLALFECEKIEQEYRRMRMNLEYDCWSSNHFFWIIVIGLPNLILWIAGLPIVAFFIIFRNRNNLDSENIKKYFLLIYQGLKRKAFYWEFVNTFRKMFLLFFSTVLSIVPVNYTALTSIALLAIFVKIQHVIQPYKYKRNNKLEMRAIIAGTMTLY